MGDIRVGVRGMEVEQGGQKCEVKWKHETKQSLETLNTKRNGIWGRMGKQNNHDDGLFWNP